jgi:hypothetical protein
VVLAEMTGNGRKMPFQSPRTTAGRTVLSSAGTWRWQMNLRSGDTRHAACWQQLIRWLVINSAGRVAASVPNQVLFDNGHVVLSAEVRGKDYQPVPDARVEAHIIGPGGVTASLDMTPVPDAPGAFRRNGCAKAVLTEVTTAAPNRSARRTTFQRMDGVAGFHTNQNRDLLDRLASQTDGRYWRRDVATLPGRSRFRSRRHDARDARALEHASGGLLPRCPQVAAAAQVGGSYEAPRRVCCAAAPASARADPRASWRWRVCCRRADW